MSRALPRLDCERLLLAIDAVRSHRRISWRDVAKETGVAPSLFSRMHQGRAPGVDALCSLLRWLNLPIGEFTKEASK